MASITTAGLLGSAALAALALPGPGAENAPAPGQTFATPGFVVPRSHYQDVELHLEFDESPLVEVEEIFTKVLRFPVVIDPQVLAAAPPPITFHVDGMDAGIALLWIARLTDLHEHVDDDGTIRLDRTPPPWQPPRPEPPEPPEPPDPPDASVTVTLEHATPEACLQELYAACRMAEPPHERFPDRMPLSLRVTVPAGGMRSAVMILAIEHGASRAGYPFPGYLRKVVTRAFRDVTIEQALAAIAQDTGLPCRFDGDSGPMPRVSRPGEPIECRRLLAQIAAAGRAVVSEAGDGMVIYRPRSRRFTDDHGQERTPNGQLYKYYMPAWWSAAARLAATPTVNLPVPPDALILSVDWHERSVAEVAAEITRLSGLPVHLTAPGRIAGRKVLVQLPARPLSDILWCLRSASRCEWQFTDDGITVTPWEVEDAGAGAPVAAPATPSAPAAPAGRPAGVSPDAVPGTQSADPPILHPRG